MKKWILCVSLLGAVLLGIYFGSPYLAARNLKQAIAAGDVDAISAAVDFPAVRSSVKAQLSAAATRAFGQDGAAQRNPLAMIGMIVAPSLLDRAVDAYVTPTGIAAVVQGRAFASGRGNQPRQGDPSLEPATDWISLNRFRVQMVDETTRRARTSLIFERRGFAGWKLVDVVLLDPEAELLR